MSGQNSQRVRRNVSPNNNNNNSAVGPLRATLPVGLMRQISPRPGSAAGKKISPSESPTQGWSHQSPDVRVKSQKSISPPSEQQKSPGSPQSYKDSPHLYKEKSKTLNLKSSTSPIIRRTASLDTIYLTGQWPRDTLHTYCGRPLVDKSTQTPDEWEEFNERKSVSSALKQQANPVSCSGEQLDKFRQRLQRSKESSRQTSASGQHHSPVHGDHSAISLASAAAVVNYMLPPAPPPPAAIISSSSLSAAALHAAASHSVSRAITIPHGNIPKTIMRTRNSVEGLNQEIEKLVLKGSSGSDEDIKRQVHEPTPDGHRAPIADLLRHTRNADTQTPSGASFSGMSTGYGYGGNSISINSSAVTSTNIAAANNSNGRYGSGDGGEDGGGGCSTPGASPASYCQSASPTVAGAMDNSRPSSQDDDVDVGAIYRQGESAQFGGKDNRKSASPEPTEVQLGTSPNINKFFAREPPDGCERVKIVEESRSSQQVFIDDALFYPRPKPCSSAFIPSSSSAFCPPFKAFGQSVSPTELVIFSAASPAHNPPLATSVEGQ